MTSSIRVAEGIVFYGSDQDCDQIRKCQKRGKKHRQGNHIHLTGELKAQGKHHDQSYHGTWRGNVLNGYGSFVTSPSSGLDAINYKGAFRNMMANGVGLQTCLGSYPKEYDHTVFETYTGSVLGGCRHGYGKLIVTSSPSDREILFIYEGGFEYGMMCGEGMVAFPCQRKKGSFIPNGCQHGRNCEVEFYASDKTAHMIHHGEIQYNKITGHGTKIWKSGPYDGYIMTGLWKEGLADGVCEISYPQTKYNARLKYIGLLSETHLPHGKGTMYNTNGAISAGEWKHGTFVCEYMSIYVPFGTTLSLCQHQLILAQFGILYRSLCQSLDFPFELCDIILSFLNLAIDFLLEIAMKHGP